jgi:hypothetical protein
MKNPIHSRAVVPVMGLVLALAALMVQGQTYSVNWHKVSGGGGVSTNGAFGISGTIGQHDAGGSMTGGGFSITGGFWALRALQTPGAPALGILITTTNTVEVYWPYPSTGWNLQVSTNLATTNWVTPPETVNDNGTINYIIVGPPTGARYYRLENP